VSVTDNAVKRHPEVRWPGKFRCTGSFVVDGTFVATQRFRGMVGIKEALYDIGASVLINSELGAEIRYADGRPFEIGELKENVTVKEAWLMFPKNSGFLIQP
jgi:fructose-1,6-bisphosphatase/inositol monophosphatase family enzyme